MLDRQAEKKPAPKPEVNLVEVTRTTNPSVSQPQSEKTSFLAILAMAVTMKMKNPVTITNKIEEKNSSTTTRWLIPPPQKETPKNQLKRKKVEEMKDKLSSGPTVDNQTECPWSDQPKIETDFGL